ncbi:MULTISPECIES: propionyl-CoA synthetase [unclassified Marinobacterium]|jgi:propionyl-CoA synthetase|uniref:propionyl-CoA synthetase n=1 Tax=unclassified Marinobacterium TaxID=2644139 RepID=UPI00156988B0|nr:MULTISPECIES: propionyl-CoA synthetase [unclassified Marinobacterium]NRP15147.1 Acetyl-coenzyme A synthetase [Marinobacterium sp. xm-a-152]NRP27874.1 Acetyl-coenzyme A synthetase [Marinobacterium sp. xm-d-420]NRP39319.1 Acetyl-coenzyme A synthetase [Marinobacterium sp. xm-a-121]NRP47644.1 Acetyl-coenzyme A synthetase [Marinobacterium sp. xm-d-543]NRP53425.1 Acetyl-coenzyme A synthetase [Marinobacterium sp. xm-v-242]
MRYEDEYQTALDNPEAYWAAQADRIAWFKKPETVLHETEFGTYNWYADGELNSCYLALDRQIEQGRGNQVALYYDSPVSNTKEAITYQDLLTRVSRFAGALKACGVSKGDTVLIYMPMIPEAAVAMLACARLGAVHSVVFGGFAPNEMAIRIDDASPKVILTASCGIEFDKQIAYKPLVDQAIDQATHKPAHTIVCQRPMLQAELDQAWDLDWYEIQQEAEPADCVTVKGSDPLYILYTSGTTGQPKGIVRDNGGHAVALRYALNNVYGMEAGDVWWGASDIGWVVGHSFIVYGPLMGGCSAIFFEGKPIKTPDAGTFWRVIDEYRVNSMFCAPTAFRAIRKEDPKADLSKQYDLSSLKWVFVAGEKLDSSTYSWLSELLKVPVIDHWWQTETGWPMTAPMMGWENPSEVRLGSTNKPIPGYNIMVLDDAGIPVEAESTGNICVSLPMPPGVAWSIWNNNDRYRTSYLEAFPGYYHTGDGGFKDSEGYIYITGRTDDVINVSGHRLSTGEMEEVLSGHSAVAECAVIGVNDDLRGQLPLGLVVLKAGESIAEETLVEELTAMVRDQVGAVACFRQALIVQRLPKTRSGKVLRAVLRKIAANESYTMPSTIDDPAILTEIDQNLRSAGF